MGRLLVEILEAREAPEEAFIPSLTSWITKEIPVGMAFLDQNLRVVQSNPALERMVKFSQGEPGGAELPLLPGIGPHRPDQSGAGLPAKSWPARNRKNFLP